MGSSNGKPVLRDEDIETIMKTSGMTEQQIRKDFEIFVALYPTGASKNNITATIYRLSRNLHLK